MTLRACLLLLLSLVAAGAATVACSNGDREARSDTAPALPADRDAGADAAASWVAPRPPDGAACRALPTYSDCHRCCLRAHPTTVEVTWEAFRACACRAPAPRACADECGPAYCGDVFPFAATNKACLRCLTKELDGAYAHCERPVADACFADDKCAAGVECDLKCPEMAPGEDEIEVEAELLDGGR